MRIAVLFSLPLAGRVDRRQPVGVGVLSSTLKILSTTPVKF